MPTTFTLADISRAHEGVTSRTVRHYLEILHGIGVAHYTSYVSDGHSDYFDSNGNYLSSETVRPPYEISDRADRHSALRAIEAHGRGETNYFVFTEQLAAAGVASWVMDPVAMTCTFCSKSGEVLHCADV